MRRVFSYLGIGLLWWLHWLPVPVLRTLGAGVGMLLYLFGRERRQVALTNVGLCFPQLSEVDRKRLVRRHFIAFARAFLDRTLGWWSSRERLTRFIRLEGQAHLLAAQGKPTILLGPHFVGLDAAGTRLTMEVQLCSVYSTQKNPVFNDLLLMGRSRFNQPLLISRLDGLRRIVRALKDGYPLYYLPDMDFGPKESIFVPFFGVPAATVTGVSRLARLTGAQVLPCITRQDAHGYVLEILPPLADFPGESVEADTLRINQLIEHHVLRMPEQYFWLHKRFKTRPPGEPRYYP